MDCTLLGSSCSDTLMCPVRSSEVSFLLLGSDAKACFHNVSPKFSAVSVKKPNISLEALGSKLLAQVAWMRRRSIRISRQLSARNILHRRLEVFSVGAILPSIEDSTGMVKLLDSAYVRVRLLALS
ncbi:hypothetical protein MTO96_040117 [Rhipicephalus appendiculatus]